MSNLTRKSSDRYMIYRLERLKCPYEHGDLPKVVQIASSYYSLSISLFLTTSFICQSVLSKIGYLDRVKMFNF